MDNSRTLRYISFCLADVRDGLGPFIAIFLLHDQHWKAGEIGIVLSAMSIASLVAQSPSGFLVDTLKCKRLILILASIVIAASSVLITIFPSFTTVLAFKILMGLAAAILLPGFAALTLGVVGHKKYTFQVGHNEAWNHAGNVFAAVAAGILGYAISNASMFYLVPAMGMVAIFFITRISRKDIDNKVARGLTKGEKEPAFWDGIKMVLKTKALLFFTISITLFHFANAAMLPLLGQELAKTHPKTDTLFMSSCIVLAQLVMIPMALLVSKKADDWGRKKIFLIAFAVLPIRGVLYTLWGNPYYLVSIQILDGIAAGIFGALFLIVIQDLTEGTGFYNLSLGITSTIMGIGVSLSAMTTGFIVDKYSYNFAFIVLAIIGAVGLLVFAFTMPETLNWKPQKPK
jgi:MFS family permease